MAATASGPATFQAVAALPVGVLTSFPDDTRNSPGDVVVTGINLGPNGSGAVQVYVAATIIPGGPTDLANQAAAAKAATVATANQKLAGVVAQLNTMGTAAGGATANAGNVVAIVNTILADLAIALPRLADLLTTLGH